MSEEELLLCLNYGGERRKGFLCYPIKNKSLSNVYYIPSLLYLDSLVNKNLIPEKHSLSDVKVPACLLHCQCWGKSKQTNSRFGANEIKAQIISSNLLGKQQGFDSKKDPTD